MAPVIITYMLKCNIRYLFMQLPSVIFGWSGNAMVLGKLPVPGRSAGLDKSRARAYCGCSRCRWGGLDIFLSSIISHFFLPLAGRWPDIDCNIVSKGR